MLHPEHMHIIVTTIQADRRLEATEPLVPPFAELERTTRNLLGKGLVRIGYILAGADLQVASSRELDLRQPA